METDIKNPNWWRRRTTLEKCLTLLTAFACIVVIGLLCSLLLVLLTNQTAEEINPATSDNNALAFYASRSCSNQDQICLTPECVRTASAVLRKMNTEINPCNDFYKFACGNFINEVEIPEDEVFVNTFALVKNEVHQQLKIIITEEVPLTEPKHFRLPSQFYKACMNTSLIETLGTKPVRDISESMGGWPVVVGDAWNNDNSWTWQKAVKNLKRFGFNLDPIITFYVDVDVKNSTRHIINLDQASIGIKRQYLANDTIVSAYYDYMVDMAVLFGADKETAKTELRQSLQFEMDLANISWPNEKRRNSSDLYNLRSVAQLQEFYPYVDWKNYINALLPEGLQIDENEVVNLMVPSFFDDLGKLLQRTRPRDIANYMMWRIHSYSVFLLPEIYGKRRLKYATTLPDRKEQKARWKHCYEIVTSSLSIPMGSLYVRKHFGGDSKVSVLEVVDDIRGAISKLLDAAQWMDAVTKQEAKTKLHAMATHVGYPDEMMDNEKLAELYRTLEIDPDKYFQSVLNMNVYLFDYVLSKLRLPVIKPNWENYSKVNVVNAFYHPNENSIEFPPGILQSHFFNARRPKYMNYGAIGYMIGHEIMHGFPFKLIRLDADANLTDLSTHQLKAYWKKASCFIEQYANYIDKQTGINLNGISTLNENIADNGGIKGSYMAYNEWASKNAEEPSLPGLTYTPKQMFWIAAAQNWCANFKTETLKMRIPTDSHSTGEFRVLGPLSNMREFSNDFQCAEGTPMNPVHKCEVW